MRNVFASQEQHMKIEMIQEQQKTSQELKDLKEQNRQLIQEGPQFKDHLQSYKREFQSISDLVILEEDYVNLSNRGDDNISFKEYLQVRVFEVVNKYQREIQTLKGEISEGQDETLQLSSAYERVQKELEQRIRTQKELDADHQRALTSLQRRIDQLESDGRQNEGKFRHMQEKTQEMKYQTEEHMKLEVEFKSLKHELNLI